jgi:hypothetical protein
LNLIWDFETAYRKAATGTLSLASGYWSLATGSWPLDPAILFMASY